MSPFDPGFRADSFAAYARMRAAAPFTPVTVDDGRVFWLVTGYEEAVRVLKDHDRFGNDVRNALTPDELDRYLCSAGQDLTQEQRKRMSEVGAILDGHLLISDPPKHSSLRRLVSQSFTPRFVEALRPRVQELADQLLDAALARAQARGRRELDLVEEFASPLPLTVMEEMLGLPMTERERFRHWSNAVVAQEATGRWNAEMVVAMAPSPTTSVPCAAKSGGCRRPTW